MKDLLDIDLIEAVAMLRVLADGAEEHLHTEQETGEIWRRKKAHVSAMKMLTESIKGMVDNSEITTVRQYLLDYEKQRGAEWEAVWGDWFWNRVEQAVMYAQNFVQGNLM